MGNIRERGLYEFQNMEEIYRIRDDFRVFVIQFIYQKLFRREDFQYVIFCVVLESGIKVNEQKLQGVWFFRVGY